MHMQERFPAHIYDNLVLRYSKEAVEWTEALPIGNGRLGAMVFGDVYHEHLPLNEDTLWSGYPQDHNLPGAYEHFKQAEKLMLEGQPLQAQREVEKHLLGPFVQSYEPLGDLCFDFEYADGTLCDYSRTLNLATAVSTVSYRVGDTRFTRECFASEPDQVIVLRFSADKKALNFTMSAKSVLRFTTDVKDGMLNLSVLCPSNAVPSYVWGVEEPIVYHDSPQKRGITGHMCARIITDGDTDSTKDTIRVAHASDALILVYARTDFGGYNVVPAFSGIRPDELCRKEALQGEGDHAVLLQRHLKDYCPLFERQMIALSPSGREKMDTLQRLRLFSQDHNDATLPLLLAQYGRYLMISASRPGTQPMNLQGIWNHSIRPPWSSNYTININTEMNYWPAEICNLSEMHAPLFDLIEHAGITGRRTAQNIFHARGACMNHNSDIWAHATPVGEHGIGNGLWGWWPMGYGWLCRHLWEHYEYTGDDSFLTRIALPAFRNAALFFIDTCSAGPDGYRAFRLATSPENRYFLNGEEVAFAPYTEMSNQIVRECLKHYLFALEKANAQEGEKADADAARELLSQLPPPCIGKDGRLLEWDSEKTEIEPAHRHISHLYGLFPAEEIDPENEKLKNAILKSLRVRGDDGTGWSLGWKINVFCRLRDGDHALRLLQKQLDLVEPGKEGFEHGGTYPNLFDAHPPFQIDGNFAAAAGVARLLIDSAPDTVTLLPALPAAWRDVLARGLCGANGVTVDLEVRDGKLLHFTITSKTGKPVTLVYGTRRAYITPEVDTPYTDLAALVN